jgi:hypothetical protein
MKVLGVLLLLAGWIISLAAVVLLRSVAELFAFVLAGVGIDSVGLILLIRAHQLPREEGE